MIKIGNINIDRDFYFHDLEQIGFKSLIYFKYKSKIGVICSKFLNEKLCNRLFKKIKCKSVNCMVYNNYKVIIDEMGYVDVIYDYLNTTETLYSGRRNIKTSDIVDAIKVHERDKNINSILNKLVD